MAVQFPAADYPHIDGNRFADLYRMCREGHLDGLRKAFSGEKMIQDYFNVRTLRGYTLLHEAVEADQPDVVQKLLLYGVPPDLRAKGGSTALHLACSKLQLGCVRALLENGADLTLRDDLGQDALSKAEIRSSKKSKAADVLKLLRSKEVIVHSTKGEVHPLEKRLFRPQPQDRPVIEDMEEAVLAAVQNGNEFCIPSLIVAGARRVDSALHMALQLERIKAAAILLLCKAINMGDCGAIRTLLSAPLEGENSPWYIKKVQAILAQGAVKMSYPIAVSILDKNYEATKELLLRTDVDMRRKQVDWSKLKLTLLHPSWMYSISPWVVSLKLVNNHLRKLPMELYSAKQLRRLDLSQNLLETVQASIFSLPNIEYLSLAHNRIKEIPETSVWSQSLLSLDLAENRLTTLPQGIQNSCIEILNLSRNQFTTVPKCLCRITTLTSLDLSSTPLTSFPPEMQHLDRLVNLNVSNANINDLPGGGGLLRGAVKGVFKARARSSKTSNYIKLVLICNTDRVKSAMLSRLKPHYTNTEALPDFDQFQWSYRPLFTRKLFGTHKLHFNTWLLGSSYEYNSIYPCFFTTGALYVLVWDITSRAADMREQIKVYVDNLVRYVPGSNVLIISILPEGYESILDTNYESLAKRLSGFFKKPSYSNLVYHGLMMVVAKQNVKEGQSDMKQQIYDIASTMSINGQLKIGRQYPETYFHLIPVLEKEQHTFQMREKPGVLEETTIWTMFDKALSSDLLHRVELPVVVDFLQESGFLLHYEDPNERLDQYYFTRPLWLYNTLLKILRHTLHSSKIEMSYDELCTLSSVNWSREVSSALIRLMMRFAIALPTRNSSFVISCLLPHCVPISAELHCGNLRRQFSPKSKGIPCDLWVRVICRILSNLSRITNMVGIQNGNDEKQVLEEVPKEMVDTDEETNEGDTKMSIVSTLERALSTPHSMIKIRKAGDSKRSLPFVGRPKDIRTRSPPEETQIVNQQSKEVPSTLTVMQISNRDRIEESDDGLTPVEDRALSHKSLVDDLDTQVVEMKNLASSDQQRNDSESPAGPTSVPLVPVDTIVIPPTPQHEVAADLLGEEEPVEDNIDEGGGVLVRASKAVSQPQQEVTSVMTDVPTASLHAKKIDKPNRLQRIVSMPSQRSRAVRSGTSSTPATLEKGLWIWDAGIIYSRKGIKFSIYPCRCDLSTVEERGIEICTDLTRKGKVIFSRLCRVIQQLLLERYPDFFSLDMVLHNHELTQLSICPVCLETGERNPTSFLVEACVHALMEKNVHNCRYHPRS